jgi:hypothetical protein
MNAEITLTKSSPVLAIVACCVAAIGNAAAEPMPDTENGRYAFSPAGDGMIRLDTRTGMVSNCNNSPAGWACYAAPDERTAMDAEIGRLQAENEKLKAQLASRDGIVDGKSAEALPKSDRQTAPKTADPKTADPKTSDPKTAEPKTAEPKTAEPKIADGERKLEIPLPSDQDMDRLMSFVERAWRRLIEMAGRVQKDVSGKI